MNILKRIFMFKPTDKSEKFQLSLDDETEFDIRNEENIKTEYVSDSIEKNSSYIKKRFSASVNDDVIIREIVLKNGREAFVIFYDGMTDGKTIDDNIIKSVIELPYFQDFEFGDELYRYFTTHSQAKAESDMDKIVDNINFGSCALFVDGVSNAFVFDVKDWEHRGIEKPENEQSIYGPQEAFGEMLRTNTSLIRKILKTEKLIAYGVKIGTVSKTSGVLLYIEDIANEKLVGEVKRRLSGIAKEYIVSIEQVQMLVEDRRFMLTPQTFATERPDRAAIALTEGRCVLILNGSPRVLVMPSNAFEITHTVSDEYLHAPFALMSRIIRLFGMFVSVLLPALYLAITLYHQEIIPTYLLYSISASRENVPFPSVVELLLMDISFELIREAGIRMPSPIGSTLGIVGGLILGQAAVSAKIVSPIMIIIIAITGIGSFSTADYSLGWTYRIIRLAFIALAAGFGFYGIALGIVMYSLYIGSAQSFGIPFLSPPLRVKKNAMSMAVFVNSMASREKRPGYLKTKNPDSEPNISRKWSVKNRNDDK
ncbi:MAG: spore germination protein [Clostridia bacterium]|nr:spore germination protein [Clostridia bacterium]